MGKLRLWRSDLRHIPGETGLPLAGMAPAFAADALRLVRRLYAKYGPIVRGYYPFEPHVLALSAEANEFVIFDRDGNFSSALGWEPLLGTMFRRGLALRDGADHRLHRRLMLSMFRKEALAGYVERMLPRIDDSIQDWARRELVVFYPAAKRLTLGIAADIFLGLELKSEVDQVSGDLASAVDASLAVARIRGLGRKYTRGLRGRARLESFIRSRIRQRRAGTGSDFFTQMCRAESETGERFDDEEVVDELIFLMSAAHDTTTSALTTIVYFLAAYPEWQDRVRTELSSIAAPSFEQLDDCKLSSQVLYEAVRLYPPIPAIPRRTLRDCVIHGFHIPRDTPVAVYPIFTQRHHEWWTNPDHFDPERFSPTRAEHKKYPFAWIPFGGGIHTCLGGHFAEIEVKAVLYSLLSKYTLAVQEGYRASYQTAPIPRPRDGLPIVLRPR